MKCHHHPRENQKGKVEEWVKSVYHSHYSGKKKRIAKCLIVVLNCIKMCSYYAASKYSYTCWEGKTFRHKIIRHIKENTDH